MARLNINTNKVFNSLDLTWLAIGRNEAFDLIKYSTSVWDAGLAFFNSSPEHHARFSYN